jgi:hypothetical protein
VIVIVVAGLAVFVAVALVVAGLALSAVVALVVAGLAAFAAVALVVAGFAVFVAIALVVAGLALSAAVALVVAGLAVFVGVVIVVAGFAVFVAIALVVAGLAVFVGVVIVVAGFAVFVAVALVVAGLAFARDFAPQHVRANARHDRDKSRMRESRTSGSVRGDGASRTPTSTSAVTKHTTEAFSIKYVGLDVHKETIAVAVADSGTAEPRGLGIIPNDTDALRALLIVRSSGGHLSYASATKRGPAGTSFSAFSSGFRSIASSSHHRSFHASLGIASRPIVETQVSWRAYCAAAS